MDTTVLSLDVIVWGNSGPLSSTIRDSLAERMDAEVTPDSTTELAIEQERLSFDSTPPLEIRRAYPQHRDIDRLAQAAKAWIELVAEPASVAGVGYGIARTCSPDWGNEVLPALGKKLLADDLPLSSWEVYGGSGSIIYRDEQGRVWNFAIEPRLPDTTKLYLGANMRMGADSDLPIEEMTRSLRDVWEVSRRFLQEVVDA